MMTVCALVGLTSVELLHHSFWIGKQNKPGASLVHNQAAVRLSCAKHCMRASFLLGEHERGFLRQILVNLSDSLSAVSLVQARALAGGRLRHEGPRRRGGRAFPRWTSQSSYQRHVREAPGVRLAPHVLRNLREVRRGAPLPTP